MDVDMIFFKILFKYSSSLSTSELPSQTPSSVSSTPSEVSAIPCVLFGNTLRALFLKNRDFFCYSEIFLPKGGFPLSRNFYVRTDVNFNWLHARKAARKGGFPLSRNFYVRTDVNLTWLYVRKLK